MPTSTELKIWFDSANLRASLMKSNIHNQSFVSLMKTPFEKENHSPRYLLSFALVGMCSLLYGLISSHSIHCSSVRHLLVFLEDEDDYLLQFGLGRVPSRWGIVGQQPHSQGWGIDGWDAILISPLWKSYQNTVGGSKVISATVSTVMHTFNIGFSRLVVKVVVAVCEYQIDSTGSRLWHMSVNTASSCLE